VPSLGSVAGSGVPCDTARPREVPARIAGMGVAW
jgi:hypothetical protein